MADTGSVLAGAGTGAAAGSAIAPGVGTVIGAGVGALGSLVSGWLSGKSANSNNASSQARNQAYWKEQFDLTNARQDWLNQNSASIQKQALRQAGLNPALAMQGSSFSGNASSVSGVGSASPSGGDYSGIGVSAGSLIQNLIGLQNLKNDTMIAESKKDLNEANAEYARAQAKREGIHNTYLEDEILIGLGLSRSQISYNETQTSIAEGSYQQSLVKFVDEHNLSVQMLEQAKAETQTLMDQHERFEIEKSYYGKLLAAEIYAKYAAGECSKAAAQDALSHVAVNAQSVENLKKQYHLTDQEIEHVMHITHEAKFNASTAEELYKQSQLNTERTRADTRDWVDTPAFWRRAANLGKYLIGPVTTLTGGYLLGKANSGTSVTETKPLKERGIHGIEREVGTITRSWKE